ncbi:MAG: toprim domain-containing protein, partial [Candidatus Margulisiibacteriota bacterium]
TTAKKYAEERGLTLKIVNFFRIGSSIDSWDSLYKHLISLSFQTSDIEKAGLIIKKEEGASHYDRFRKRLMFPIWDQTGRVIAFGARSLDGLPAGQAGSNPKYINSPDSPVYNKGSVLYGLNFSKDDIKAKNQVYIIEGYMDFIRCYAHGIKNIVASSGTSLTNTQIKLLQRYTNNIVLVFDSDAAGATASERSIEALGEMGIFPKVVSLEGGKDPDEILRKEGIEKMKALLDSAAPSMKYKLEAVIKRHNIKEAEGKAKAAGEAAAVLSKEKNQIIKDEYIKFVSNRLGISSENFLSEIKRASYYKGATKQTRATVNKPDSKILKAESTLLRIWMEAPVMRQRVMREVKEDDFSDRSSKTVFTFFSGLGVSEEERSYGKVIDMIADNGGKKLLSQIALDKHDIMDVDNTLKDCVTVLKSNAIRSKISAVRHLMKEAEEAKDLERLNSLQSEYLKYHGQILAL